MARNIERILASEEAHIPAQYDLVVYEMDKLAQPVFHADSIYDGLFDVITNAFDYGFALGRRCEKAAQAKRRKAKKERGTGNVKNVLAQCRMEKGISQEELAIRSGIPQSVISELENGSRKFPTTKALLQIANALCVRVDDLFKI